MVSKSIKDTITLQLIPGSIPICVQMVFYGDEWIFDSTIGRQFKISRLLPTLARCAALFNAKVFNRQSPSNPHLEQQRLDASKNRLISA